MIRKFSLIKQKGEYSLALDIGTSSVKSLIFRRDGEKIIILGVSSQILEPPGVFWVKNFQKDLLVETLTKTIQTVKNQFSIKARIESYLLGLPANILKSRVAQEYLRRRNFKEKIQPREEKDIVKEVLRLAEKRISQKIAKEFGILPQDFHLLDSKILAIKIDGYEVPGLSRFSGKILEFKILATFLPKYYLKIIEKITRDLDLRIVKVVTPIKNLLNFLEDKKNGRLFLDIGGEVSQIILVKDGKIHSISEFLKGGETFTQRLSETLGIHREEAEDLKIRYSRKLLSEEVRGRIQELFWQDALSWFNSLKSELKKISDSGLIPSNIFLFGGGSQLPEIEKILKEGDWENLLLLDQLKLKALLPKDLRNIEDQTQRLDSPQNIPTLLICYL